MVHKLVLVSGPRNSGKTTMLLSLIDEGHKQGLQIAGVLALANEEKTWYRLLDLSSGRQRLALLESTDDSFAHIGRFAIFQEAFDWANKTIEQALASADLIVFDEIGRLELDGGGLAPSFVQALSSPARVVAAVRDSMFDRVSEYFGLARFNPTMLKPAKDVTAHE